jgi:predicted nucleic acid-binding protein
LSWRHNAGIEEYSTPPGAPALILADTSVWIDHLRTGNEELQKLLGQGQIVIHPFVIAELALGSLRERPKTLALLDLLPQAQVARMEEVRLAIEARRLYNHGIGLIDAHLIASCLIGPPTLLWTKDKRLQKAARRLRLHANLV